MGVGYAWASGGGSTAVPNVAMRVRLAADFVIPTNKYMVPPFSVEDYKTTQAGLHGGATQALTGTVAKTAASATLTGTGTAFLTELVIGDSITVPGTANETRVITAIASNTSLTADTNFANTASGQAATVDARARFYAPTDGVYSFLLGFRQDGGSSAREINIYSPTATPAGIVALWQLTTAGPIGVLTGEAKVPAGGFVCPRFWHGTGSNVTLTQAGYTFFSARYASAG